MDNLRIAPVPNTSALAWEITERYPSGAQLFCLNQDVAEELRDELSVFSQFPVYILPAHDIDSQTQRRPALYERKERLRFISAFQKGEKAYFFGRPLLF